VNYAGRNGVLSVVPRLRPGDVVTIHVFADAEARRYVVDRVRYYDKHPGLPASIFEQNGPERLALITCGGTFDSGTGNYDDNVVAYAHPA
jgi:hypothetical protein